MIEIDRPKVVQRIGPRGFCMSINVSVWAPIGVMPGGEYHCLRAGDDLVLANIDTLGDAPPSGTKSYGRYVVRKDGNITLPTDWADEIGIQKGDMLTKYLDRDGGWSGLREVPIIRIRRV